ncbi:VOC family protein [Cellulomonas sp. JZ18]|uniref:VOC family protein n=1 Tax=Cellulomonas sp. JZ18 TaxID=2654191 RepID=UPI0012D47BFE|nr:VOC family protein [Cellulomonas sp. JZ18]QGQ18961.1 VOC family protein [Cellulomonas sp. JZ18]
MPKNALRRTSTADDRRRRRRHTLVGAAAAASLAVVAVAVGIGTRGSEDGSAQPLHADTRLGAVELHVRDLDAQRSFYAGTLGLEVLDEQDGRLSLGADGQELVRLVRTDAPAPSPREAGLYHSAILYPDAASLAAVLRQVAATAPGSYQGASDHSVSQAFYLSDPEGNGVELYVDRPRSDWRWRGDRVEMGSAPLDPNAFIARHGSASAAGTPTVGHVHLKVGDLTQARRFYVDVLGFEITSETDGALFMSAGGYHHHLAANTWSSRGAGTRSTTAGLGSFSVLAATAGEIDALAERLTAAGLAHERTAAGLSVADPWGTEVLVSVAPGAR